MNLDMGPDPFGIFMTRNLSLLFPAPALVLILFAVPSCAQESVPSTRAMSVEFLYSIEYTSGRSDKLREPMDIFFDRKKNEFYIVEAGQSKIYVYDNNGMFMQEIRLRGIESPPGMAAVDGRGNIYVGYVGSPKISVLDYKGELLEHIDLPGIVDVRGNTVRPFRLCSGPDGRVYALKTEGGIVKIGSDDGPGEEIRISGSDAPNAINGFAIDNAGRFLFTDLRPYSVVIYEPREKTTKRFGIAGVLYGQIARPTGIAADDAGHIFVLSGTTSKVTCYDREGNFVEEFGGLGDRYGRFYMPTKIASDGKDRLFVLESSLKRVQVFKIRFINEEKQPGSIIKTGVPDEKPQRKGG